MQNGVKNPFNLVSSVRNQNVDYFACLVSDRVIVVADNEHILSLKKSVCSLLDFT
jgi:hypothetical protein